MKTLFDLFPVILFFIAYKMADIYIATAVLIAAVLLQITLNWILFKTVEKAQIISGVLVVIFGGITLLLHDPIFLKWKPTILNWLFGIGFLGSQFIGEKPIIKRMMGHAITAPDDIWKNLNFYWVAFFAFSGSLNLYVAFTYDEATWVNFKLFGLMGLTVIFILFQTYYLRHYMTMDEANTDKEKK